MSKHSFNLTNSRSLRTNIVQFNHHQYYQVKSSKIMDMYNLSTIIYLNLIFLWWMNSLQFKNNWILYLFCIMVFNLHNSWRVTICSRKILLYCCLLILLCRCLRLILFGWLNWIANFLWQCHKVLNGNLFLSILWRCSIFCFFDWVFPLLFLKD